MLKSVGLYLSYFERYIFVLHGTSMKSKILFRYLPDDTLLAVHHDNQQVADVQGAPRHRAQCPKRGQADYFDGKEVVQLRTRKINSHFFSFQMKRITSIPVMPGEENDILPCDAR